MAERETAEEKARERAWHEADLAARQVVDMSGLLGNGSTLLMNTDARGDHTHGVVIGTNNQVIGLFVNGRIIESSRFDRDQFDQFMRENKELALALDVRETQGPTQTPNGSRDISLEVDYDNSFYRR